MSLQPGCLNASSPNQAFVVTCHFHPDAPSFPPHAYQAHSYHFPITRHRATRSCFFLHRSSHLHSFPTIVPVTACLIIRGLVVTGLDNPLTACGIHCLHDKSLQRDLHGHSDPPGKGRWRLYHFALRLLDSTSRWCCGHPFPFGKDEPQTASALSPTNAKVPRLPSPPRRSQRGSLALNPRSKSMYPGHLAPFYRFGHFGTCPAWLPLTSPRSPVQSQPRNFRVLDILL